jgi:hypothetical protein
MNFSPAGPAIVLCLAALATASPAPAATYVVLPDGSGDFPTIQAAVDVVVIGDFIELADGTYRGPGNRDIDFHGKAICIRSQSGVPDRCVIDCEGSVATPHRGAWFHTFETPDSRIEHVTITNGYETLESPCTQGGAVLIEAASLTLTGCVFAGCTACVGGGVSVRGLSTPSIVDCLFRWNVAVEGGAASLSSAPQPR